jgi:hypothetical protein
VARGDRELERRFCADRIALVQPQESQPAGSKRPLLGVFGVHRDAVGAFGGHKIALPGRGNAHGDGFAGADPAQEQLPGHLGHPPTPPLGLLDQPVAGVDAVETPLVAVVDQGVGATLNR